MILQAILPLKSKFPMIEEEAWKDFANLCTYKKAKNKERIIKAGQIDRTIIYIHTGVLRGYVTNSDGEEVNLFLRGEKAFLIGNDQLIEKVPTKYTFESILQSELLLLNLDEFEILCKKYPSLYEMYLWGVKTALTITTKRMEGMIQKTPEERYSSLLEQYPIYFQKAFNKHIANYLGITPVSLSRIIKRIKEKK